MPADLSEDRLGRRCLDLLDDMQQWGQRKYLPAEVDVFEIDRSHELYGHMNINYLKLAKMPTSDDWSGVLDVLRRGDFFSTTGEIVLKSFSINRDGVEFELQNTFPLAFAEVIWGDGKEIHRERMEMSGMSDFGNVACKQQILGLKNAKWARLEVWDIARNGAYTQVVTPAEK